MKQVAQVIVLPANDRNPSNLRLYQTSGKFYIIGSDDETAYLAGSHKSQHLYLTNNEEIKEGDYYYDKEDNLIFHCKDSQEAKARNDYRTIYNEDRWFLVIATTDKSLTLACNCETKGAGVCSAPNGYNCETPIPQIPDSFVKAFVEAQGKIKEVLVEYEQSNEYIPRNPKGDIIPNGSWKYKLKLRDDNTVIIYDITRSYGITGVTSQS